ncbi:MAG: polysaccharide biosynthesis tyrosine autokinase [Candidatus Rokuibacteriota bacterium]
MPSELPPPSVRALPIPPTALRPFETATAYPGSGSGDAHFWDYWRILVRHRWTVVLIFLGALLTAAVWTFTSRPLFTASATLRIDREEPRVVKFEQVVREDAEGDSAQTQLQTYHKLLQSRALATRVVGLLDLGGQPEFRGLDRKRGELLDTFFDRLRVDPVRNSRLVKVSFQSRSPELSARVANGVADTFIAQQLDQKVEATRHASTFLLTHVDDARRALEAAEAQLTGFLEENDILFVATDRVGDRTGERQSLIGQQLVTLSESLLKARAERIAKESLLAEAGRADTDSLPAVLQNSLIAHLKQEATALEGKYRELSQTFKPEYPRLHRLAENIAQIRRQLREEGRRVVGAIRSEYGSALQNETELRKLMDDQQARARKLDAQMARYNLLRREADVNRELYATLSSRLKETRISSALLTSNISIVDRAEAPVNPTRPRTALNLMLGGLIGICGGIAVAFFFEHLDTSIRDPRQVEAILRVPTLGLVPARAALSGHGTERRPVGPFALVAHHSTSSVLAEAFRGVRTSVVYATPDRPPRTLLVTSLQQQDGKTSVSTNCAISLAQLGGGDVLLIDADMRHPNLHEILGVPQVPGLSDLLAGGVDVGEVIRATKIPGLYVVPAGPVPVNPTELLASRRLTDALASLEGRFAHIVIDTPPMLGISDTLVLAPRVEGVILVLRHGRASRSSAQRAVHMLSAIRARILGVVLNHVDAGSFRGEGYGSYYRDDDEAGVRRPGRG